MRIAVVEDDPGVRALIARVLSEAGHAPEVFASGDEFLKTRRPSLFDVVVSDLVMEGAGGLEVLQACRAESEPAEVLLVTGHATVRSAVEAMRLGAFDYLAKPFDPRELRHRVEQAFESRRLRREVQALAREIRRRLDPVPLVAESPAMKEALSRARKAAATSSTVLLLGETGTGKEVVARYIQAAGPRADKTCLTVNCAALAEELLESELFGHAAGAFPGARAVRRGLFEEADGGTLFLDQVTSMSPAAQAKMLRVVEEGTVRRVGEARPIPVDVRILAATNRDIRAAVAAGQFREDLFFRLSVVTLSVPPLRERREDIEPLSLAFLAESARRLGRPLAFAPGALETFRRYAFPGNVRELRYAIEQAAVLSEDGVLRATDFPFAASSGSGARGPRRSRPVAEEVPPERLEQALREQGGNRVRAAKALGISRATLYRLLESAAAGSGGKRRPLSIR